MKIKTRAAPSPTWFVHIWTLRLMLYDYLWAKKNNWIFLLRLEDTDQGRMVAWWFENIVQTLKKVWMVPDEWPAPFPDLWNWPYIQSERLPIYREYIQKMIDNKTAYYCFCTEERLEKLRQEQEEMKIPTKYDEYCRNLDPQEVKARIEAWEKYVVRLKVPKNETIIFNDLIRWKVVFNTNDIDDQVLLKSDSFPSYFWAIVVDDFLMKITHVFKWEEWLPSMPKIILIARALWIEIPETAHLPLVLWNDHKKLSKRTWDVAVEEYLKKWYLIDSIINYIAFLWWNPKTTEEFFTMDELIKRFDIKDIHKAWAIFDIEKLNWMNSEYIKKLEINSLYNKLEDYLKEYDSPFCENVFLKFPKEYNLKIVKELQTRLIKFEDFKWLTRFFYNDAEVKIDLLKNEKMWISDLNTAKNSLNLALEVINSLKDNDSLDEIKNKFIEKIKLVQMKNWQVLWPVRVSLSGEEFSPGAFELISILWREKSIARINKFLDKIN